MLIGVQSAVNCPSLLSNLPQGCNIVSVVGCKTKGELLPQQLYGALFLSDRCTWRFLAGIISLHREIFGFMWSCFLL